MINLLITICLATIGIPQHHSLVGKQTLVVSNLDKKGGRLFIGWYKT
jgi:hypothetical protein